MYLSAEVHERRGKLGSEVIKWPILKISEHHKHYNYNQNNPGRHFQIKNTSSFWSKQAHTQFHSN